MSAVAVVPVAPTPRGHREFHGFLRPRSHCKFERLCREEFGLDQSTGRGIDGRQHGRTPSEHRDGKPRDEPRRIRHLNADVPTADYDGRLGRAVVRHSCESEASAIACRKKHHPMSNPRLMDVPAPPGGNHETPVNRTDLTPSGASTETPLPFRHRFVSRDVGAETTCRRPGGRTATDGPEFASRQLTAMKKRQPADAEVRKLVGHDKLRCRARRALRMLAVRR